MGKFYDEIPAHLVPWINKQEMFWVATAPLSADGHVNVSPKGLKGTFHLVSPTEVWYEDMTGSGSETIAHLRENGRVTIMFNAFDGPPQIVRLFGRGVAYEFGSAEYNARVDPATRTPGSRAIVCITVHKVGTSCGYAVPLYAFERHRTALVAYAQNKEVKDQAGLDDKGLKAYWREKNTASIDGLPALAHAYESEQPLQHVPLSETKPTGTAGFAQKPGITTRESALVAAGFAGGLLSALLAARLATGLRHM